MYNINSINFERVLICICKFEKMAPKTPVGKKGEKKAGKKAAVDGKKKRRGKGKKAMLSTSTRC